MANDSVEFTITWDGAAGAKLHYAVDNDVVIATEADNHAGHGRISFTYPAAAAAVHVIEWSIFFPGATVRKLAAKAAINGATPSTLDKKDEDTKNKWASRGAAP